MLSVATVRQAPPSSPPSRKDRDVAHMEITESRNVWYLHHLQLLFFPKSCSKLGVYMVGSTCRPAAFTSAVWVIQGSWGWGSRGTMIAQRTTLKWAFRGFRLFRTCPQPRYPRLPSLLCLHPSCVLFLGWCGLLGKELVNAKTILVERNGLICGSGAHSTRISMHGAWCLPVQNISEGQLCLPSSSTRCIYPSSHSATRV